MPGFIAGSVLFDLSVALGIGLLVGAERERQKGEGPLRRSAGIRTFATASLCGFAAQSVGSWLLLAAALLVIGALAWASYQQSRQHDPGMTSEMAILLTFLLGAMSVGNAGLAAVIGIVLTALLAQKERIHQFVRQAMTRQELDDLIIFLAAIMIVLPLAPNRFMGPFDAVNWHQLTRFVILVMTISALGHMLKRHLGQRGGLVWAGLLGGFISSTATVANMARLARSEPAQLQTATAGALLSSVSTFIQLGLLVAMALPELLSQMLVPMGLGACVSLAFALLTCRSRPTADTTPDMAIRGHAFDLAASLWLALALLVITVLTAGLNQVWGDTGAQASAALSGLVDAHATVATMGGLVDQGLIAPTQAQLCIWMAVSTNSISKAAMAAVVGGKAFALQFLPGLLSSIAAVWLSQWVQSAHFWL
jgi:uncharacterized membrane protein (DUF4010 family)